MSQDISKDMFIAISADQKEKTISARPIETYWQDVIRRIRLNRVAIICMYIFIAVILIAIFVPFVMPYSFDQMLPEQNAGPSFTHIFGTDQLGRDLFVRVLIGLRISLLVGLVSALLNFFIGTIYGGISGYFGGIVDNIMMRIVDILYTVPTLLYVILLMVVFGAGLGNIFIALGISYWVGMARIVRGQMLSLKQQEFVLAAKAVGSNDIRIIFKHLIPNAMGPIIVSLAMSIPTAIFTEAFLSFIGLGVSAPMASLGALCSDAQTTFRTYPYQMFFPAIALAIIMITLNLFGDGLRDALDPKMRK